MNLFTKSLISSLFAPALMVAMPSIAEEIVVEREIEISAERGKDVRIHVTNDDDDQVFIVSFDDLKNLDALDDKLQGLDRDTMAKIKASLESMRETLDNAKHKIEIHKLTDHGKQGFQVDLSAEMAELDQLDDLLNSSEMIDLLGDFYQVRTINRIHRVSDGAEADSEEHRVIVIDAGGSNIIRTDGSEFRVNFGDSNLVLKGHVDAILKMINHGQFSAEELEKIQQALNEKF